MITVKLVKQLLYGAGYLALFFLIIFGAYSIWFKSAPSCFDGKKNQSETGIDCGGSCPACAIKTLADIEGNWVKKFSVDKQSALSAEIKNSNSNYGAIFSYGFDIYTNNGEVIKTQKIKSFIYPSQIKYVFDLVDVNYADISEIRISFFDVDWKSEADFSQPKIQKRDIFTKANEDGLGVEVSGLIINNNPYPFSKAEIAAFLVNSDNIKLSASKTELNNLMAYEERFFKIIFPKETFLAVSQGTPSYKFSRDLKLGSKGEDVSQLQQFLKENKFFIGEITGFFGAITKQSLMNYQKSVGISPAAGYFGTKTRNYINSLTQDFSNGQLNFNAADPNKTEVYVEAIR
ncbi:MAG: peptidoglycan-binding protein [Patescibacteria group bacterium]